jgi:predicted aspartyl protease
MGTDTMGKTLVAAKIENIYDLHAANQGTLPPDQVRTIEVADALVDTGATNLSMPRRMIQQLGLTPFTTRRIRTSAGLVQVPVYGVARLTVLDRYCTCDVAELPDDCPVLIGQVPLELMDYVVDPANRRLIGNPDHKGEWMFEQF